ncbi:MAG: hypothetical protein KDD50_09090, partial [Bdellovibrionales bacterium]|nr:hypothetical protein [Bdellovibrionales bacterium]
LQIVGRNNSQIAMVFDIDQMPTQVLELIKKFKIEVYKLGLKPDDHSLDEFLPHISIAHIRNAYFNSSSHFEIAHLVSQSLGEISEVRLSGGIELLDVNNSPAAPSDQSRYSSFQQSRSEEELTDLSPGDFSE